ncbi:hypothetical protein [Lentisalinibacter orientalis]|uniref:hypothetical protein n=1 Tax=Lentisalinibacter orientalis TaxID=2992241 RepID=UPI00386B0BF0
MRRRWFFFLLLTAIAGVLLVGGALWQTVNVSSLSAVAQQVDATKPYLVAIRLTLIGVLAITRPYWSAWTGRSERWNQDQSAEWQALRWRVVGWLVAIELIIGQDLLAKLIEATTDIA